MSVGGHEGWRDDATEEGGEDGGQTGWGVAEFEVKHSPGFLQRTSLWTGKERSTHMH